MTDRATQAHLRFVRARIACALSVPPAVILTGCATHWKVQPGPAAEVVQSHRARDYLVTRIDGNQLVLRNVLIDGDSLVGSEGPGPTGPDTSVRRAVNLADIRQVAVREPDRVANTFWLTMGGIAVMLATLSIAIAAGGGYE